MRAVGTMRWHELVRGATKCLALSQVAGGTSIEGLLFITISRKSHGVKVVEFAGGDHHFLKRVLK